MRRCLFPLGALLLVACGGGEVVPGPCQADTCTETCLAEGSESGACADDVCVCQQVVEVPGGATVGLSSGGTVNRRSSGYQLSVSVGPVAPAAEGSAGDNRVELGVQPQTTPER